MATTTTSARPEPAKPATTKAELKTVLDANEGTVGVIGQLHRAKGTDPSRQAASITAANPKGFAASILDLMTGERVYLEGADALAADGFCATITFDGRREGTYGPPVGRVTKPTGCWTN